MLTNSNLPYEQQAVEVQVGIHLNCHSVGLVLGLFVSIASSFACLFSCTMIFKLSVEMTLFISMTGMLISAFIPMFFISRKYPAVDIATLTSDSILLHYYSSIRFDDVITYEIRRNDINLTLRPGVIHGDSITFTGTGNPELFTPFFECLCSLISRWQYSPKVMPQTNIKTTKKMKKNKSIQNDKNQSKAPQEYFFRGSKHGRIQGVAFILAGIFGIFCGFMIGEFMLVFMAIIVGMFGITLL